MHSCASHQRKQSNKTEASASSVNPLRFVRSRRTKNEVRQETHIVSWEVDAKVEVSSLDQLFLPHGPIIMLERAILLSLSGPLN
jgi:hypothetical protein